ncbi:MAG: HupE/UreJ family protein [Pseudomonadota bacterium]
MMDPLLCAQLADLDRAVATSSGLPAIDLDRSAISTLILYTQFGVEHILPWGLDHLAFVLALILSTTSLRVLLIQISLFTLAHSVTLALGVMNIVQLNSLWVELAIALSIIFVAIDACGR